MVGHAWARSFNASCLATMHALEMLDAHRVCQGVSEYGFVGGSRLKGALLEFLSVKAQPRRRGPQGPSEGNLSKGTITRLSHNLIFAQEKVSLSHPFLCAPSASKN